MATFDGDFAEVCADVLAELGVIDAIKEQYPESDEGKFTDEQINQRIDAYGRAFQRLCGQLLNVEGQQQQPRLQKAA